MLVAIFLLSFVRGLAGSDTAVSKRLPSCDGHATELNLVNVCGDEKYRRMSTKKDMAASQAALALLEEIEVTLSSMAVCHLLR